MLFCNSRRLHHQQILLSLVTVSTSYSTASVLHDGWSVHSVARFETLVRSVREELA